MPGYIQRRGIAHVIGLGLEGQAKQRDSATLQNMQLPLKLSYSARALRLVDLNRRLQHRGRVAVLLTRRDQGRDILTEARSTPSDTGIQKGGPDTVIGSDGGKHLAGVGPQHLAQL